MRTRRLAAATMAAAVTVAVSAGCTDDSPEAAPAASASAAAAQPDAIVDVVSAMEPSVVTIHTGEGLGSGVIYRADGVIVTNAHVVGSATRVQVSFADGTQIPGQVTGSDDLTDLAVVKVGRDNLPAVTVRQELPRQGETALALGSPLGFENTVTKGIISGVSRQIPASTTGGRPLVDLIQTDAPISPGNSGGALLDAQGRLVGVNEAYIPPAAGAVSLGFAIPASTVVDVTDQLLKNGKVAHPFLGVVLTSVTPEVARALGMDVTAGAVVRQVQPGSPAATAGIRTGDVIVGFQSTTVETVGDVYAALRTVKPGDRVTVKVNRGGTVTDLPITLGTLSR
ncbi:S1C family serine protease [Pseudosporangium ferrugineum]|uniref:S1-C subfamily serine protease n=1 Tax=Pseudosporangium ferrugineum TaxID=439699 RepID=A0A2T0RG91_9ACTN|nr:trypsin-like peptidase domain-containing protein [Pseudosporangium ferrugineum]PRY20167.1 S1-C subfamily serine protease [Pseudosporangium ferrugineum]